MSCRSERPSSIEAPEGSSYAWNDLFGADGAPLSTDAWRALGLSFTSVSLLFHLRNSDRLNINTSLDDLVDALEQMPGCGPHTVALLKAALDS